MIWPAALALALAAGAGDAPAAAASARIDVIAADLRGRVVETLKAPDFDVTADGKPLAVESVRLVKAGQALPSDESLHPIASAADEQREAALDRVRLFGIFLDD